jgi:hypothetical protein
MKVEHIYEIPTTGGMAGGDLYDKYGNLEYFADVTGLTDKTFGGVDTQYIRKSHQRQHFMRDTAPATVAEHPVILSRFGSPSKGALPGYTVMFVSDAGLPGEEKRQFQYTGTVSGLIAWLKTTAKMLVDVYGPTGSLITSVPGATP